MALQAKFVHGSPLMVDYKPTDDIDAGEVFVINERPYVAHSKIEANTLGALAMEGGVYELTAAGNYSPGEKVYWDATAKKITIAESDHAHFGWIVPSSNPNADGDPVQVLHRPDGTVS
jgi:predicted RecA/RadA family phage recombinase